MTRIRSWVYFKPPFQLFKLKYNFEDLILFRSFHRSSHSSCTVYEFIIAKIIVLGRRKQLNNFLRHNVLILTQH